MMASSVTIRPLKKHEIPLLKEFAPADWNTDLAQLFSCHFGQPYFHSFAAEREGEIVGCGNVIINGEAGWLGNIIVLPPHRSQGIGSLLTAYMSDFLVRHGVRCQLLIATKMGEPMYRKLGFRTVSRYHFLRGAPLPRSKDNRLIRAIETCDIPGILELDRMCTGEERSVFLDRVGMKGFVYASTTPGRVEGYFLPTLGNGCIVAKSTAAGLALLEIKMTQESPSVVIPGGNSAALDFAQQKGFQEFSTSPRMCLGSELDWKPECLFSRATGHCG